MKINDKNNQGSKLTLVVLLLMEQTILGFVEDFK